MGAATAAISSCHRTGDMENLEAAGNICYFNRHQLSLQVTIVHPELPGSQSEHQLYSDYREC